MPTVRTAPLYAPLWRRGRFWLAVAVLAVLGGLFVAVLRPAPGVALDPTSAHKDGSKALAVLLAGQGAPVAQVTSLSLAEASPGTVVVVDPAAYTAAQLQSLHAARLVLVAPGQAQLQALEPAADLDTVDEQDASAVAGCSDAGARAAGAVAFPVGTLHYDGDGSCFDGRVLLAPRLVVLGSPTLLRNDHLADDGVAALDLTLIGRSGPVVWLMPTDQAATGAQTSIWSLLPDGARRTALWLLAVGGLLALWRGRRLGPVVREPLPVVVRAAEIVEGHGRLYRRAGARDRAAVALRTGTRSRLARRLGLPRSGSPEAMVLRLSIGTGVDAESVHRMLDGPAPTDDAALLALAADLDDLERRL